ncbi:MAG TPA: EthD family reductase [Thermoanaerobaculia bacterium]|jgi:uncharacterized protein (TIGR02118 family)
MIQVSAFYPNDGTTRFDADYYCSRHIPMVQELLGEAIRSTRVEKGLAGAAPGEPPAFHALAHFTFDSVETFQAAFGAHAEKILGDAPNYTDVQPVLQISEVVIADPCP